MRAYWTVEFGVEVDSEQDGYAAFHDLSIELQKRFPPKGSYELGCPKGKICTTAWSLDPEVTNSMKKLDEDLPASLRIDSERDLTPICGQEVWDIPTASFSEAHFATFPPALVMPCIMAGCPEGGTVLDPFGGAGTTALVADRMGRDCTLIELNPEYIEIARKRIEGDCPMFVTVT